MSYISHFFWLLLIIVTFGTLMPGSAKAQGPDNLDPIFDGDGLVITNISDKNDVEVYALSLQPDGKIVVAGSTLNGNNSDFALIRFMPDGSLDPTFDGDGKILTDFNSSSDDVAKHLIIQADGKIVVAGYSGHHFALARYNANGTLDITFGGDGKVTDLIGEGGGAVSLVLQDDGKLVVAGYAYNNNYDFALVRYNPNGSLDSTFDGDGKVITDFNGGSSDQPYELAIQLDGKFIIAGFSYSSDNNINFALARYNPNGSLDSTFDGDGKVITDFNSEIDSAHALVLQPDGKIIAAGTTYVGLNTDFALARYNINGSLDSTFDGDGKVTTDFSGNSHDQAHDIALQPGGKIIVTGYGGSSPNFALARYNTNGSLDSSFEGDGKVITSIGSSIDVAQALALQLDGKIVVAGTSDGSFTKDIALARYHPNGSLDSNLDNDGKLTISIGSTIDVIRALALQPDGKIVVAGYSRSFTTGDFALARYHADGSLDLSFGKGGKVTTNFSGSSNDEAYALVLQPDGKIIAAGLSYNGTDNDFALARYNVNGSLDPTFDNDGKLVTNLDNDNSDGVYDLALQPDGKIVAVGLSYNFNFAANDFALARYNTNGSLDATFGGDGKVITNFSSANDLANSVILQPDGKVVVAGYSATTGDADFALARYNSSGGLDSTFDGDGKLTTNFSGNTHDIANDIILQPDSKIVVTGYSLTSAGASFALARYNSNGSSDPTFDGDGKLTTNFSSSSYDEAEALILQPDGKIVVTGTSYTGGEADFALACYQANGSLDLSFDGNGKLTTDFGTRDDIAYALVQQPDGKLIVAGYSGRDFALARYYTLGKVYLPIVLKP